MKRNSRKLQRKNEQKKLLCVIGIPVGILVVIYLVLALFFRAILHFVPR